VTWSAVGVTEGGTNGSVGLSNQGNGNLLVAEVINFSNNTVWCTGLSGSGATWVPAGVKLLGTNTSQTAAVFLGTVTATGAGSAAPSWSGTTPANFGIVIREFHSTVGSWTFITQGNLDSAGTANWPSLNSTAGDLYYGYCADAATASAGSTSGYTYDASGDGVGNGMAFNVNCPGGATNPVWGDSGQQLGIVVLVREGSAPTSTYEAGNPQFPWPAPLTSQFGPSQPFDVGGVYIDSAPSLTVNAGVATAHAVATNVPFKPFVAGLAGTGYNSYFVDQAGNPRLMVIEQCWSMPFNAGRWNSGNWQSDFTAYFSNRAAQGYTAWYGLAWGSVHNDPTALSGGRSWDGVYPLKINGTPGAIATGAETVTLNTPFWDRIDAMFATARQYGIACFLNLGQTYDLSDTGAIWLHATNTQATAFGNALATRFPQASYPHVHWFWGDDDGGGNDSFWGAMLTGMQNAGDTRTLFSIEYLTNSTSHVETDNGAALGTFGAANAAYNWAYCYDASYFTCERAYSEGGTFTHIPAVYGDGIFYGDTGGGGGSVDYCIRTFVWWGLASGSRGFPATSGDSFADTSALWKWQSDAVSRLTSDPNGSFTTTAVGRIATYFSGLTDWHKLIPDTGNVFVTGGRGTRGTCDAPGSGMNVRTGSNYVAAAITPNGTLAVLYCRAGFSSVTIDQTKMNAGYTATWVDPSNPTLTQSATPGSTYSSSGLGNNASGDPDWVLVLQAPSAVTATAGVAAASAVAVAPLTAHTSAPGAATSTAVASGPSVASTTAGGVATGLGSALSALAATGALPGVATGSATALGTSSAHTATSGVASSLAAGAPAVQGVGTNAGVAISLASALTASDTGNPTAGVATGSATAPNPSVAVTVSAGVATASAVALSPTVNTSGSTNAPAGAAAASALGVSPQATVASQPSFARSTATALTAQGASAAQPGAGGGSAVALQPVIAIAVHAGVAAASALASPATVSTSSQTNANAGVAAATATAMPAAITSAAQSGVAGGLAIAPAPVAATGAKPGAAAALSTALPAVIARPAGIASSSAQAAPAQVALTVTAGVATASAVASGAQIPKQVVPGTVTVPVVKVATAIAGIAGRASVVGRSSDV